MGWMSCLGWRVRRLCSVGCSRVRAGRECSEEGGEKLLVGSVRATFKAGWGKAGGKGRKTLVCGHIELGFLVSAAF